VGQRLRTIGLHPKCRGVDYLSEKHSRVGAWTRDEELCLRVGECRLTVAIGGGDIVEISCLCLLFVYVLVSLSILDGHVSGQIDLDVRCLIRI